LGGEKLRFRGKNIPGFIRNYWWKYLDTFEGKEFLLQGQHVAHQLGVSWSTKMFNNPVKINACFIAFFLF
jgi:hypothetical protein